MKVLVTGGAGYIGSHLVDNFLSRGDSVSVIDNLFTGSERNIAHLAGNNNFIFIEGTILNRPLMEELVAGHDLVCHLAAVVGVKHVLDDPVRTILDNALGTEIVLTACHNARRRVLFSSTSEIYGKNPKLPFSEDDDSLFGSTRVPRWSYAVAKSLGEHLSFAYHARGLPVTVVRYVNSYGPRLDPRGYGSVVANFISQALSGKPLTIHGDGKQTRCFTFVDDTVGGTVMAATREEAVGHVFNIGSSVSSSILELAGMILDLTGSNSPVRFVSYPEVYGRTFEDMTRELDPSKAEKILGFRAKTSLKEGLQQTIEWFRERLGKGREERL